MHRATAMLLSVLRQMNEATYVTEVAWRPWHMRMGMLCVHDSSSALLLIFLVCVVQSINHHRITIWHCTVRNDK